MIESNFDRLLLYDRTWKRQLSLASLFSFFSLYTSFLCFLPLFFFSLSLSPSLAGSCRQRLQPSVVIWKVPQQSAPRTGQCHHLHFQQRSLPFGLSKWGNTLQHTVVNSGDWKSVFSPAACILHLHPCPLLSRQPSLASCPSASSPSLFTSFKLLSFHRSSDFHKFATVNAR